MEKMSGLNTINSNLAENLFRKEKGLNFLHW